MCDFTDVAENISCTASNTATPCKNAIDYHPRTVWFPSLKQGGVGEWIQLDFNPATVRAVNIRKSWRGSIANLTLTLGDNEFNLSVSEWISKMVISLQFRQLNFIFIE